MATRSDVGDHEAPPTATDAPGQQVPDFEPPPESRWSPTASLREIGRELWTSRDLLMQVTLRDVRLRYRQAVMGFGWAVLTPLLIVLAGIVIRVAMARYAGSEVSGVDVANVAVKGLGWAFFVGAIGFATPSIVANHVLVTKVYFPREVLPLSAVLTQTLDSLVGGAAVLAVLPFFGVRPAWAWAWVPLVLLLLFLFVVAAALVLSCANLFFRDVKYIVQVALTFGIFFTPVLLEPVAFGATGAMLVMLNPLSPLLEALRLTVIEGHNLLTPLTSVLPSGERVLVWTPWYLAYASVWSVAGVALAALLFHRLEDAFAERI